MLRVPRVSLVALTAAAMGLVGLALLPGLSIRPGGYAAGAAASVVLWLCLSPLVYRQSLGTAVTVGLLSPLIAIAPASPILIVALLFDIRYWVIFPVGALTGVLVRACLAIGQEGGRGKPKQAAGFLEEPAA